MKLKLRLQKMRFFFLAIMFAGLSSQGQVLLTDDFNYATGQLLTANGWTVSSGGTTQAIDATAGLSFSGYGGAVAGSAANLDNNGQDLNRAFASQSAGVVYVASVIQTSASNAAGYFMGLSSALGATTFFSRLWVNSTGNGINVSTNAPSSYVAITPGVSTLVVLKFDLSTKITSLYVLNSFLSSEPASASATFAEAANTTTAGAIFLRQYDTAQRIIVDGIRIANTWSEAVLPAGPLVNTTAATNLTTSGARLNSSVNGYGTTTSWSFDYGTTTSYGLTVAGNPASGSGASTPFADISSLVPATLYNYRVVATNGSTITNGNNLTFYTLASVPNAPVVSNPTTTTLDVSLDATTTNGNPAATTFAIQTGTQYVQANGSLGATAVWQTAATWSTVTVTGLTANTSYSFQVKARNGATTPLETAFGPSASASTVALTSPNLTLVTDITAFGNVCTTASSTHYFAVSGANLDGSQLTVNSLSGYSFSFSEFGSYTADLQIAYTGNSFPSTNVYVKFTPSAVQTYNGNIAISGGGLSSSFLIGVTGAGVNTGTSVTTNPVTSLSSTGATLNGSYTLTGCTAISAAGFEYSTTNNFTTGSGTIVSSSAASGSFSAALATLAPATTYYYKANATDGAGIHYGAQQSFTTSAIGAITATAATSPTQTSFVANWNAVTGATEYRLDVATSNTFSAGFNGSLAEWTFVNSTNVPTTATSGNTSKTVTTNASLGSYAAGVTDNAINATGWQSGANSKYWQLEVNTTGVSNIHVTAAQRSSNTGPGEFKVQYRIGTGGTWTDIANSNVSVNTDFSTGTTNVSLPSEADNQASVFIRWIMRSNVSGDGGTIAAGGTSRLDDVIVTANSPTTFVPGYTNLLVNGTSQTVSGLAQNTTYYYRVRAVSTNSTSANSNTIIAQTLAAPVATFGGISQAAGVCAGGTATFNVTGLLYPSTTLLTYNIAGGSSQTVSLVSDASGNATFTRVLTAVNSGQTLTVTSVQRTDITSASVPVSTNNTVILVSPASVIYYADSDGDTYGNPAVTQSSCTGAPEGYVADNTDCNDGDTSKHTSFDFYADSDNDGFGSGSLVSVCAVDANTPPTGYSLNNTDCAPTDNSKWQSANLFVDADSDGYTTSATPTAVCYGAAIPAGYTTTSLGVDCKDDDNTKHDSFGFYVDGDGDTYGSTATALVCAVDANTAPAGYSVNNTDCNDGDANKFQSGTLYVDGDFDGYSTNATAVVCYGASVPAGYVAAATAFDCNDAVAAINPGHTEVLYNGVDDNCDGNLDEGNQLLSNVITQQCGITLAAINSVIQVTTYPNITQYRYRVYKIVSGNPVGAPQFVERAQPYFTLTQMSTYEYAATYSIQVELQRNGTWLGYYGSACQVSTPALLDNPNGSGSINPSLCGQTLATISTLIATPSLQSATAYKFRVTNITDPLAPGQVQEIERSQNYFALTMLPYYFYGTTYNVEVSVKASGVFSGYGATCPVTSPSVPMINNCDQHMAQPVNYISTASLNKVVSYRFEISLVDANDNPATTFTLDRTLPYFSFNMVPNYVQGGKYMVRVALRTTGYHSPFGEACFVYAPVSLRQDGTMKPEVLASRFDATVFPNPYVESFSLDFDSTSEDKVQLRVYDMIGKLLEERNFETTQIELAQFGQKYPSGVYNIVLTQGGNVKKLRVIKR